MGLDKFSAALDLLTGFNVNLYVGEDIFKGKLLGVETDHVVLETDNKYIFYYNIDKIQAITKNTKQFQPEKTTVNFQKTQSLTELLKSFQHSWVTILSINKQKFTGVLSEIDADFATLINGEERILIKLTHVSNILKGFIKEEEKKENEQEKKQESKNESKNHEKEEESDVCETKEYTAEVMTEANSKQTAKAEKTSAHHIKSEKQEVCEVEEVIEPNKTMGWSQPIKTEPEISDAKTDHTDKGKKPEFFGESHQKIKHEIKKPTNEMKHKENKNDEAALRKLKGTKSVKQPTNPPAFLPAKMKDGKSSKSHEAEHASTPVTSHMSSHKAENVKKDNYTNDTKNVWKQKDQETRAFRFTGEPVSHDSERSFPFAGWPTKSKRTFRF
ncbi:hypothetical protein [Neobacillus jeddahensis]|uniref:hypothetical protein n=1 Tax=Neobacillus jeddahensis TaxID=1461580 RepID=UPI00058AF740|nr:hypothetical protein [Neobacillus jeddahensis]